MDGWEAELGQHSPPMRTGSSAGRAATNIVEPKSSALSVALLPGTCLAISPGICEVQTAVAMADPTELPISVMRRTMAVTVATSTWETEPREMNKREERTMTNKRKPRTRSLCGDLDTDCSETSPNTLKDLAEDELDGGSEGAAGVDH